MADILYPSCKLKASYPKASDSLRKYLMAKGEITVEGCCKPNHHKLKPDDRAIVMCNNCAAIIEESSAAGDKIYVWELILADKDFNYPNYHGELMTVQDCWLAKERLAMQAAVRGLLEKMNISIAEQERNYYQTTYHGKALLNPCNPLNARLAPRRYENGKSPMFPAKPLTDEEQAKRLSEHNASIKTDKVVCACKTCQEGIVAGGKVGVHILELLFPT